MIEKKEKSKKKRPVDESVQIYKAREKLKKRMEALEKKNDSASLRKKES